MKADILRLDPAATPNQIQGVKGTWTWTFRNGTVTMVQVGGGWGYADTHWRGRYTVRPGTLVIGWSACPGCPPGGDGVLEVEGQDAAPCRGRRTP